MTHIIEMKRRSEAGFTLVELAIVMVIIGLLIGGILKGQELIANSEVTATIAQVKGVDAGISGFKDKYGVLPGDMTNPNTRLSAACNVAAPCNTAGTGDGRIGANESVQTAVVANSENHTAFLHLAAASFIQGVEVQGAPVYGQGVPTARVGGGLRIGFSAAGTAGGLIAARPGHYVALSNALAANPVANDANGAVTGSKAANIDRKLDDGIGNTGSVQGTGTNCVLAAGPYDETDIGLCSLFMQVQG